MSKDNLDEKSKNGKPYKPYCFNVSKNQFKKIQEFLDSN